MGEQKPRPPVKLLPLQSAAHTDSGIERQENQDSYCVLEHPDYCLYAVADGMGGLIGGSAASSIAVNHVKEYIYQAEELSVETLQTSLQAANRDIYTAGQENPEYHGMGTTFAALGFVRGELLIANVGDSRAYRYRDGNLTLLTEDHTFGAVLRQTGVTSTEKAEENPMSHFLYRSVGPSPEVEPDIWLSADPPQTGDIYLVCTDGLYTQLKDYEIAQTLETNPIDVVAKRLVTLANERAGKDNVTVIAVKVRDAKSSVSRWKSKKDSFFDATCPFSYLPWCAFISLIIGTLAGFILSETGLMSLQDIAGEKTTKMITSAFPNYKPPAGLSARPPEHDAVDIEELKALGAETALPKLEAALAEVRLAIEVATRKLSIWHSRREHFFRSKGIKTLAAKVSVSSPSVKEKLEAFRKADWLYLKHAEEMIYQPMGDNQDEQVAKLSNVRDKAMEELRKEIQNVIDLEISDALYQVHVLSSRRDKLQTAVGQLSREIGTTAN